MIGEYPVAFLSIEKYPWQVDGRSGVSYPLRVLSGGKLFKLKATEEMYDTWRDTPQLTPVIIKTEITSSKENIAVECREIRLA